MAPPSGDVALLLILLAAVLSFFAFWTWRLRRGIRVRLWFVALFALFYELLFLLVLEEVLRLPWGQVAFGAALLDVALFGICVFPGFRYTLRTTRFEHTGANRWVYRGRLAIPAAWLSLFLFRYGVELAFLGQVFLFTPLPSHAVAVPSSAVALIAIDALFAASTGLVMGDSMGIWWAYNAERARRSVPGGALDSVEPPPPPVPVPAADIPR